MHQNLEETKKEKEERGKKEKVEEKEEEKRILRNKKRRSCFYFLWVFACIFPLDSSKYLSTKSKSFRPTDEGEGETEVGLIAQHLESIPELAHTVGTSLMFDDETIAKKKCQV